MDRSCLGERNANTCVGDHPAICTDRRAAGGIGGKCSFQSAYEIFPNQPLVLRNWAQLRFNEGDQWGAYRLIDRMEKVIPNELEPYSERILIANNQRLNYDQRNHETCGIKA